MKRTLAPMLVLTLLAGGCGADDGVDEDAAPSTAAPATQPSTATTAVPADPPAPSPDELWNLDGIEIDIEQPPLWRSVASPPEGSDAAVYAPSDNNVVAERLLVKAVPLDAAESAEARVEAATDDLEDHYGVVLFLEAIDTVVGVERVPAQQIRFTWENDAEAGVGWRWVVPADTQLIYITLLADLSEPSLYLLDVQDALLSAVIGG